MKRFNKSLLLVALTCFMAIPAHAQSTQGREFWVSSTIACSPEKEKSKVKEANPYIAISTENACTVTITGGEGNAINITQKLSAGSWNEFGNTSKAYNTDPTQGLINVQMDASKWYPKDVKFADDVVNEDGQTHMFGLHITATASVSVYVILSSENSMDASNILPVTALGSEYYTQDYFPEANDFSKITSMITILGTENNTVVDVTLNGETNGGKKKGDNLQINLTKGQTYYIVSKPGQSLAGTHIVAKNDKKIAVFNGCALTRIPNGLAARDCLFEQPMPVDFWGTDFIVTRSLEKDGNLVGITAITDNTEVIVDGYTQTFINEGETYYIMLQNEYDAYNKNLSKITSHIDQVIIADAVFIQTSCPCAVFNYDTGRNFKGGTGSELNGTHGDPSSVWVSPIQQKIRKITFGTCYTKMTEDHFLNVVTETRTCNNTKLTAIYGATTLDKSDILVWQAVPGNPDYSYARAKIGDSNTKQFSVFRLENTSGVIATVYGNGDDESYAYSAGSSAIKLGIELNGFNFENGTMGVDIMGEEKFCVGNEIGFDFSNTARTRGLERVELNFGDGTDTTFFDVTDVSDIIYHTYMSPTWYDVEVKLVFSTTDTRCKVISSEMETTLKFSFPVVHPDTVPTDPTMGILTLEEQKEIIETMGEKDGQAYLDQMASEGIAKVINPDDPCYVTKLISLELYCLETEEVLDTIRGQDYAIGYDGNVYYKSQDVEETLLNPRGCNHYRRYRIEVVTCLDMNVKNDSAAQHTCPGETLNIPYEKIKGDIEGDAVFKVPGFPDQIITLDNDIEEGTIELPISNIKTPGIYVGELVVNDKHCKLTKTYPVNFAIYYPETIIKYKFNNTVAVYKKGYGGNIGYDFTDYQWFLNGDSIGTNSSILYLGEGNKFHENDEVYVVLKDKSGHWLPSCPIIFEAEPEEYGNSSSSDAQASKRLENRQIIIRMDDRSYNIYGQRVR